MARAAKSAFVSPKEHGGEEQHGPSTVCWCGLASERLRRNRVLDGFNKKTKMMNRVRRLRGQVEAIERALEQEIGYSETLQLIASTRGAIDGLMAEVMEGHIRTQIADPLRKPNTTHAIAAEELIEVVKRYLK
jgi:FrmR/RcnR family transcriptional regulator, repressor of frmRAB operon